MLRFIPLFVNGATCNLVVALTVGRISRSILLGESMLRHIHGTRHNCISPLTGTAGIGCAATGAACLLFANIVPRVTYWAFGFPAAILVVFGADL